MIYEGKNGAKIQKISKFQRKTGRSQLCVDAWVVVGRGCPRGPGGLEIVEAGGCVGGRLVPTPHHTTFILHLQEKITFIEERDLKRI